MEARVEAFESFLYDILEMGTFTRGSFTVISCTITEQEDFYIVGSHTPALTELNSQLLLDATGKTGDDVETLAKANVYGHVIGKMIYIG